MRIWNPSRQGGPSQEIDTFGRSHAIRSVLDLGCGTGRNLVPFDKPHAELYGVDIDSAAVREATARYDDARADSVQIDIADIREYDPMRQFELVICYGVLHFLKRAERLSMYARIRALVQPGGFVALAAFNSLTPIPVDLRSLMPDPASDGHEMPEAFSDWTFIVHRSYQYEDEHDGGSVRHTHSIDRLIAQAPKIEQTS
jgi:trans-aconitate methyltransferase